MADHLVFRKYRNCAHSFGKGSASTETCTDVTHPERLNVSHMEEIEGTIDIDNFGSRAGCLAGGELHDASGGGHEAGYGDGLVLPAVLLAAVTRICRGPSWVHTAPAERLG